MGGGNDKNNPAPKDGVIFWLKVKTLISDRAFSFLQWILYSSVLSFFKDWSRSREAPWYRPFQSRARYFSTCLLERLLLWRDAEGPAGGKWQLLKQVGRRSPAVLLSALLQAPQMKGVGDWRWRWWGADIAYQVLWGAAMTHVRSAPYLMMYAGRQYNIRQLHGCIHAVSNVKVWNITRGFIYIPEQPAHPLKSVLDPWLC